MRFPFILLCLLLTLPAFARTPKQETLYQTLKKKFGGRGDMLTKRVKRLGNNTVGLIAHISNEMNMDFGESILRNLEDYEDWALKDFNKKMNGGLYLFKVLALNTEKKPKNHIEVKFRLDIPIIKPYQGTRQFKIKIDRKKDVLSYRADIIPVKGRSIKKAQVTMTVFPAEKQPGRVWIGVEGTATLSWLLYQAMPEKLLNSEIGPRLHRLLANYVEEEDRLQERALASQ